MLSRSKVKHVKRQIPKYGIYTNEVYLAKAIPRGGDLELYKNDKELKNEMSDTDAWSLAFFKFKEDIYAKLLPLDSCKVTADYVISAFKRLDKQSYVWDIEKTFKLYGLDDVESLSSENFDDDLEIRDFLENELVPATIHGLLSIIDESSKIKQPKPTKNYYTDVALLAKKIHQAEALARKISRATHGQPLRAADAIPKKLADIRMNLDAWIVDNKRKKGRPKIHALEEIRKKFFIVMSALGFKANACAEHFYRFAKSCGHQVTSVSAERDHFSKFINKMSIQEKSSKQRK